MRVMTMIFLCALAVGISSFACRAKDPAANAGPEPAPPVKSQDPGSAPAMPHSDAKAPDWQMKDTDGKSVRLGDFAGKKGVLLVFFATWCPYCMEEVPQLIAFSEKYKAERIEVIGVAIDQPARVIRRFAHDRKVNYRLLLDEGGRVATAYGVTGIPALVGIDASGAVRFAGHALPTDQDALVKQLSSGS